MSTVTAAADGNKTTYTGSAASLNDKSSSALPQKTLGQMDFLKLLTAQLQTQDPFNPMKNSDLVAQMATITNSSGIAEMNQSLAQIQTSLSDARLGGAASWIGRSMLVTSNIATPGTQGDYAGQFTLDSDVSNVSVDLVDGNGNTVKSISLGAQKKGDVSFNWNGRDASGNYIAGDRLQVKVRGANPTSIATWTSIAAVQSPAGGGTAKLITPLGTFAPADAQKLS